MRVAIIGRTQALLSAAELILAQNHVVPLVWTCKEESYYGVGESAFEALAHKAGALYVNELRINDPKCLQTMREAKCDVALSINWPTLIGQSVIECFPCGILNAHAGNLPRYRGNAPLNWAILNGESTVALCIHKMVPEFDAGPVLVRARLPLTRDTYIGDLYDWFHDQAPKMFAEAVSGIATSQIREEPQSTDPVAILRCYPRRPEDGRINWSQPVELVYRLIRASSRPFGGAFSMIEGDQRVTVWRAKPEPIVGTFLAVPGQVCGRVDGDPVVACLDGMLRLTEIDVPGVPDRAEAKKLLQRSLRTRLR